MLAEHWGLGRCGGDDDDPGLVWLLRPHTQLDLDTRLDTLPPESRSTAPHSGCAGHTHGFTHGLTLGSTR